MMEKINKFLSLMAKGMIRQASYEAGGGIHSELLYRM